MHFSACRADDLALPDCANVCSEWRGVVHVLSAFNGSKLTAIPLRRLLRALNILHENSESFRALRKKLKAYITILRKGKRAQRDKDTEARFNEELRNLRLFWPQIIPQRLSTLNGFESTTRHHHTNQSSASASLLPRMLFFFAISRRYYLPYSSGESDRGGCPFLERAGPDLCGMCYYVWEKTCRNGGEFAGIKQEASGNQGSCDWSGQALSKNGHPYHFIKICEKGKRNARLKVFGNGCKAWDNHRNAESHLNRRSASRGASGDSKAIQDDDSDTINIRIN
ncbi:hypothetical protein DFH09DRAFT_1111415 [Mycena vulgaris]|nr:hypothetical protein DFH09DRAFT_1111415 [Mycena vulgaris]